MLRWIATSATSHTLTGLALGALGVGIFFGWLTAFEAQVIYLILLALLTATTQALVLRRFGVSGTRWSIATFLGITLGIALPDALLSQSGPQDGIALFQILPSAIFLGLVCGTAQWAASRPRPNPTRWIVSSIAGWSLLLLSITAGAYIVVRNCLLPVEGTAAWPLWTGLTIAALCGGLGGATYAALTAPALPVARA